MGVGRGRRGCRRSPAVNFANRAALGTTQMTASMVPINATKKTLFHIHTHTHTHTTHTSHTHTPHKHTTHTHTHHTNTHHTHTHPPTHTHTHTHTTHKQHTHTTPHTHHTHTTHTTSFTNKNAYICTSAYSQQQYGLVCQQ